jgi:hypothetical protein
MDQRCEACVKEADKALMAGFDHPCRRTCSGWQQGYERGFYEMNQASKSHYDELKAHADKLAEAFEYLLCEISPPMFDDPRLRYTEHQISRGSIEAARKVFADYALKDKGKK